jgi:hypothetical protein
MCCTSTTSSMYMKCRYNHMPWLTLLSPGKEQTVLTAQTSEYVPLTAYGPYGERRYLLHLPEFNNVLVLQPIAQSPYQLSYPCSKPTIYSTHSLHMHPNSRYASLNYVFDTSSAAADTTTTCGFCSSLQVHTMLFCF